MQVVGQPVMKKDAMALVTGKPVFTQDVAPADCLVVKVLRMPSFLVNRVHKNRCSKEGSGNRSCVYLGRCTNPAFYHGRTDISGAKSL